MPTEKRRFSRIGLKMGATITTEEGRTYLVDELLNVSMGGCLVETREDYVIPSKCQLVIRLGEETDKIQVAITGTFVRREKGFTGIQFTHIDPDSLFHLQNLIRYNADDPDTIEHEIEKRPGII